MNSSISNFRKAFLRIILPVGVSFVAFLFLLDFVFTKYVIEKSTITTTGRLVHLLESEKREIPVFGSSRALCSYIPWTIHPDAYNYGIDGASLDVTNALLQIAAEKKNNDTIIVNFDYESWKSLGDVREYIPLAHEPVFNHLLKETGHWQWNFGWKGLRYFNSYDYFFKEYLNEKMRLTKEVIRGYTHEKNELPFDSVELARFKRQRLSSIQKWTPKKEQLRAMENVYKRYKNKFFIVSVAPYHSTYYTSLKNLEEVELYLKSLDKLENVWVIKFNTSHYADSLFKNTSHLNQEGAEVFSREFRKVVFP